MTNVPTDLDHNGKTDHGTASHLVQALLDPDLLVVCWFAAVGVLLTVCLIRVVPFDDLINVLALAN
jgi:hypothetical protein